MLKSITKKMLTLGIASVVLLSFSLPVKYQTNFSGTWALNEGKSELGQFGGRGVASKIIIDQKTDDVTVSRTSTGFQGETLNSSETLTADGKTSESTVFATAKKKSVMKWASDGQSFSVTFSIAMDFGGQATEFNGKENWSLGADGKTLILQNNITTPQGEISTKAVYDKQ